MKIKLKYIPTIILTLMTAFAGFLLSSASADAISEDDSADARVDVNDACGFDTDDSYTSSFTPLNGTADDTDSDTNKPTFAVTCNNITGFSVKAVGYSPDATYPTGNEGNTDMYSTTTTAVIPTGSVVTTDPFTTSSPSVWGMRISDVSASTSYTINSTFDLASHNFAAVPSATSPATTVVHFNGSTTALVTGTLRADYGFYISQAQAAGTYTGKVKYTIIGD